MFGWGSKSASLSSSTASSSIKLFYSDEPFNALPPRPHGLRQDPKNGTAPPWKEGFVTQNPGQRDEYKAFVQWAVSIPHPVYKTFVERVCVQAAREHGHGRVQTESAHVYCGYPPSSHGGPNRRPAKGNDDYSLMTIWREGGLGSRLGSSEASKERITWWRVAGSARELDWKGGKSGAR